MDERDIDLCLLPGGQLFLRFLGFLPDALHGFLVRGQVDIVLVRELVQHPVHNPLVEVVTTEVVDAFRGLDLVDTISCFKDGHVERAATEVVYQYRLVPVIVQAVCECGRGWLVQDTLHLKPGDLTGVLGGLALRIIEMRRDCNHGLCHVVSQLGLCVLLQFLQDHRGNLLRRILIVLQCSRIVFAHVALDRFHRVLPVGQELVLRGPPDQPFIVVERHDGRCDAFSLVVLDDCWFAVFERRHCAPCRSKIDADDSGHMLNTYE